MRFVWSLREKVLSNRPATDAKTLGLRPCCRRAKLRFGRENAISTVPHDTNGRYREVLPNGGLAYGLFQESLVTIAADTLVSAQASTS